MVAWSRRTVVEHAIADWAARGVISDAQAQALRADLPPARSGPGFRGLVILLGCLCLGAALITFVAANWEDMARLTRVGLVFAALWAAWGGAVWAGRRGATWVFEGLTGLACIAYGAAIMLIAQIYHIQGNAADAVWLWAAGTFLAAAVMRAQMPLVLALGLAGLWFVMDMRGYSSDFGTRNWVYLAAIVLGAGLAWWNRSRPNGHLVILSFGLWGAVSLFQLPESALLVAVACAGLLTIAALALFSLGGPRWLRGWESAVLCYAIFGAGWLAVILGVAGLKPVAMVAPWLVVAALPLGISAALALVARARGLPTTYDLIVTVLAIALVIGVLGLWRHPWATAAVLLAMAIWVLRMGWRLEIRALRVLGILGFLIAMLLIYAETLGSLIGTAGFYLGAGVILLGGAWGAQFLRPGGDQEGAA